jgi:ATP-dependent Clp protease ATP-binding subunit ClpB
MTSIGADFLVNQPEGGIPMPSHDQVMAVRVRHFGRIPQPRRRNHSVPPSQENRDGADRRHPDGAAAKLLDDRKITVKLDASARDWLADRAGIRPTARPLKRDPEIVQIRSSRRSWRARQGEKKVTISGDKLGLTFNGRWRRRR